jgi:ubiquinone biosynthesis protein UbiJ
MPDSRPKTPLNNEELQRQYEEVCRLREDLKRLLARVKRSEPNKN